MVTNFGDFQNEVYAEAVHGVTTRYPFDFASIERKASEALPDWVYRYVSAAAGDGRTQRANIAAFSCYGIVPRMMVSPPERDLSTYGGAESLTHYLRSFLAELDLCLAVCGFKDIATLKEAGVEEVINSRELLPG
jgi:lactate 2-monooxygenase